MHRVAIIGGKPAPVVGAKDLDIAVTLFHEPGKYDESEVAPHCADIVPCSITDAQTIFDTIAPLHREQPFDAILTNTEDAAIPVGWVVQRLGMPGTSELTSRTIKDKALTRDALLQHGVSPVQYRQLNSAAEAANFLKQVGGRIVVKPATGVASLHIHVVESADEAGRAWQIVYEAGYASIIGEEFLDGEVVSVDSFSHHGRHLVVAMSEYQMNDTYVEWEVSTVSDRAEAERARLTVLTGELLDAVGLTDGPAHSEFVLTPEGPRVLETHNRLAGSGAPYLARRATGLDLSRMFLTVPLGIDKLPNESPEPARGAAIRFFTPAPGRLAAVHGLDTVDATVRRLGASQIATHIVPLLPEFSDDEAAVVVARHDGDLVTPLDSVKDCMNGYVIATGDTRQAAVDRCAGLVDQVQFETR